MTVRHSASVSTFEISAYEVRLVSRGQDSASSLRHVSGLQTEAILTGFMKRWNTRLKIDDIGNVGQR